MIIIIESGGSNFIDTLRITDEAPRGLMPFLDSIAGQSIVFRHTIATGRVSSGGATAVLAGFPAFDPFFFMQSPANGNNLDAPARLLRRHGWSTAFFYGCNPGSFTIDQMAAAAGYDRLFNRKDYPDDSQYDGAWGIFDEPMGQFAVNTISELSQPFIAAWFTVSAHAPFTLPEGYDTSTFRHPEASPERGLEYTDAALRSFFEEASRQPWFENTTFVITGDHGNREFKDTPLDTPWLQHHVPFIIYAPDGGLEPRCIDDRVVAQFDIPSTILAMLNFPDEYIQIGTDALDDGADHYGIARLNGLYYVFSPEYGVVVSGDGQRIEKVFDLKANPQLLQALPGPYPEDAEKMLTWTRALLQDYTARLHENRLGHPGN